MKNNRPQVLVVDDEPQIHRFLAPALVATGYQVMEARTGVEALGLLRRANPEAVILDLGLPDVDGQEILIEIRKAYGGAVLVLSARDLEVEKIIALDNGADDYIDKPFQIGEFLARLRASVRNKIIQGGASPVIVAGGLEIDLARRLVRRGDVSINLTPKEFKLLHYLAKAAGKVITHRQLLMVIWGPGQAEQIQYLRVLIGQVRQKIEEDPSNPKYIITSSGIGYRFFYEYNGLN